jgi:dUTP pyrophosphatase
MKNLQPMSNPELEEDDNDFLDRELSELNKVIQSANELVQQLGGQNPMSLLQNQYMEMAKNHLPTNQQYPGLVQPIPETVILNCVNRSDNPFPKFAKVGDSGFDLRANLEKPILLKPMRMVTVSTGLYFEVGNGYEVQVRSRSGLAKNNQVFVMNQPGTVDSGYRGEVLVMLFNLGENEIQINHGDRIAQGVVCPVVGSGKLTILAVNELSDSERGTGGFGHTGSH